MMTKIKVGDTVIITNVAGIMYGSDAWNDGDVTEVAEVYSDGNVRLVTKKGIGWLRVYGKPTFLVTCEELHCLAKLLPVNGVEVPSKKPKLVAGERVRVVDHPYELTPEQSVGTIMRRVGAFESRRGDYVVKLDNYVSLTFLPNEMEAIDE